MVHQTLASKAVVLKPLIEVGLLENDAIMDAGNVITSCAGPMKHFAMITFGPSLQSCQQVVRDLTDIQLIKTAAATRCDPSTESVIAEANLLQSIEIEIVRRGLNRSTRIRNTIEQCVGFD
jgi:hypothetical protein